MTPEQFAAYLEAAIPSYARSHLDAGDCDADEALVDRIYRMAKDSRTVLTEEEIAREITVARLHATTRLDA